MGPRPAGGPCPPAARTEMGVPVGRLPTLQGTEFDHSKNWMPKFCRCGGLQKVANGAVWEVTGTLCDLNQNAVRVRQHLIWCMCCNIFFPSGL